MILSSPAGKSDVADISPSNTAGVGRVSLGMASTVLPTTIGASTVSTKPSSDDSWGATTATTPLGVGNEKLKKGPATGLAPPSTWVILSAHPAYQTIRSIERDTQDFAAASFSPSASPTCSASSARR